MLLKEALSLKDIRGAVVWFRFPHSDQSQPKIRPVFVAAELDGKDFIGCKISTTPISRYDKYSVEIENNDFEIGGIPEPNSKVCPNSIYTLLRSDIQSLCGKLKQDKQDEIITKIVELVTGKAPAVPKG